MITFTKEQLIERLQHRISVASGFPESEKAQMDLELARIALASLEAEVAGFIVRHKGTGNFGSWLHSKADWFKSDEYEVLRAYTAPPAPVSVPDGYRLQPISEYDAMCAAMLQGADGALTNEDTKKMDELVMWIKRLAHSLRKASPDSKLQSDAMDYLSRKGLIGVKDILR